jgi:O-acetylserine/cysteine efflux transporter
VAAGVIAYSAIGSTLAATGIWASLLARHSAVLIAPLSLLVPVFGMSLSALLLHEQFDAQGLVSAALVLIGLIISLGLVSRRKRSPRPQLVRNEILHQTSVAKSDVRNGHRTTTP